MHYDRPVMGSSWFEGIDITMKKALLLGLCLCAPHAHGETENYWELGGGVTGIRLPLYPGSSQEKNYLIPFPFLRIRTEHLEVDDGVRGFFYQSPNLRLNVSGDFGVPVDSRDSVIRRGMPDLDTVLQVGPSLEIIFAGGRRQPSELRLELPLRLAVATDLHNVDQLGWVAEPRLSYETLRPLKTGFAYEISGGLRYAGADYHAYYYDVPQAYATTERPAYTSDSGFSGYFMDIVGNWRKRNMVVFAFVRYQNLNGATYEDSPLVQDTRYYAFGIGAAWIFSSSHSRH